MYFWCLSSQWSRCFPRVIITALQISDTLDCVWPMYSRDPFIYEWLLWCVLGEKSILEESEHYNVFIYAGFCMFSWHTKCTTIKRQVAVGCPHSMTGLSTFTFVTYSLFSELLWHLPSALGLPIACSSQYSATSLPRGLANTHPLGLGVWGWSHLCSLPPQRSQGTSMRRYMRCQVTDLKPGSDTPTGLICLRRYLVDMSRSICC